MLSTFLNARHLFPKKRDHSRRGGGFGRPCNGVGAPRRHLAIEWLEQRELLTVFTVTNTAPSGPGSLWQAITDSNNSPGPNTINFDIGSGQQLIVLKGFTIGSTVPDRLPDITETVTIDGTTQPGYSGTPLIELDGDYLALWALRVAAPNCVIRGLDVVLCRGNGVGSGIVMDATATNTTIDGNIFGTDGAGSGGLQNAVNLEGGGRIENNFFADGTYSVEFNGYGAPRINSATTENGATTVSGTLRNSDDTPFVVKFYDDSRQRTYLGSTNVTTDSSGNATFTEALGQVVRPGDSITATATDANNNVFGYSMDQQVKSGVTTAAATSYVTAVYKDVLSRAPDSDGLAHWTAQLESGAAISGVAAAIAHSPEYYANFVIKPAYLKLLGRAADADGVQYWTAKMQNGLTDQQLEAGFVASDEFYLNAGGNNKAWIDAIYKLLLGRTADTDGENYWLAQLDANVSRGQVALLIANSAENDSQLINADYEHYLGRAAESDGLTFWLKQFSDGQTNEDVIAGFTGSGEYYKQHTS